MKQPNINDQVLQLLQTSCDEMKTSITPVSVERLINLPNVDNMLEDLQNDFIDLFQDSLQLLIQQYQTQQKQEQIEQAKSDEDSYKSAKGM